MRIRTPDFSRIALAAALVASCFSVGAQDAAPEDANEVNSRLTTQRPWGDSPIEFPASGPLPARWVPDLPQPNLSESEPYELLRSPSRSAAQVDAIRSEMPPVRFSLDSQGMETLPRTRASLESGGSLRVMALGDSIVNDLMRSSWVHLVRRAFPAVDLEAFAYFRGGGGCHYFVEGDRLARVMDQVAPDLVIIGGISTRSLDDVRTVVQKLREANNKIEIVLSTGAFGSVDPRNAEAFAAAPHSGTGEFGLGLRHLAAEEGCAFLDVASAWAQALAATGWHPHLFYRDPIHANEFGEQVLADIVVEMFRKVAGPSTKKMETSSKP